MLRRAWAGSESTRAVAKTAVARTAAGSAHRKLVPLISGLRAIRLPTWSAPSLSSPESRLLARPHVKTHAEFDGLNTLLHVHHAGKPVDRVGHQRAASTEPVVV